MLLLVDRSALCLYTAEYSVYPKRILLPLLHREKCASVPKIAFSVRMRAAAIACDGHMVDRRIYARAALVNT